MNRSPPSLLPFIRHQEDIFLYLFALKGGLLSFGFSSGPSGSDHYWLVLTVYLLSGLKDGEGSCMLDTQCFKNQKEKKSKLVGIIWKRIANATLFSNVSLKPNDDSMNHQMRHRQLSDLAATSTFSLTRLTVMFEMLWKRCTDFYILQALSGK